MLEADSISGPFSLFKSKLKQESGKKTTTTKTTTTTMKV